MSSAASSVDRGPDLWGEARKVRCETLAEARGVKLRRQGARLVGPCPECGGDAKSARFSIEPKGNVWYCFACAAGGDVIALQAPLTGVSKRDAALALVSPQIRDELDRQAKAFSGSRGRTPNRSPLRLADAPAPLTPKQAYTAARGAELLKQGMPAQRGFLAQAWLQARGLDPLALPGALDRLLTHPAAFAGAGQHDRAGRWTRVAPALVARVQKPVLTPRPGVPFRPEDRRPGEPAWFDTIGAHVTYLSADGTSKARLSDPDGEPLPTRKLWGQLLGGAVVLTGVAHPDGELDPSLDDAVLVVGEGLETTWSVAQELWRAGTPCRAVATLSLQNLQGAPARDGWGAFDPDAPRLDPELAPFTLPNAGDVILLVDRDMAAVNVKAKGLFGRPVKRELDSDARARLCAALASQAWKAAGAQSVTCLAPQLGQDFNDALRAVTGRGA
mgnify:CR=1 FL=1